MLRPREESQGDDAHAKEKFNPFIFFSHGEASPEQRLFQLEGLCNIKYSIHYINMSGETPRVTMYGSSVSGNRKIKDAQTRAQNMLQAHNIAFRFVDCAADEAGKQYMRKKSTHPSLPQFFTDGEFRGGFDAFDDAVEGNFLEEFLGLNEPPKSNEEDELQKLAEGVDEAELAKLAEEV